MYKFAIELSNEVFYMTMEFPKDEKYSLTDQIWRSSRSIGAQIAEAWGKRRYESHFISKLTDADSEQMETQHWIEVSEECKYIDTEMSGKLTHKCESTGKMLQSVMDKSSIFCRKST